MKQYLEASFILSGILPSESEEELTKFFNDFTTKINQIKDEGNFKIEKWKIGDKKLRIDISSDNSISPHVAILRIRKLLGPAIGKKFRVGVRGFEFIKYVIETEIEIIPESAFSLPLTESIEFKEVEGKKIALITIDPKMEEDFIEKGAVERIIKLVSEKISKQMHGAKKEHHEIVWYSGEKELNTEDNPTTLLQKANWIHRTNYRNQWILSPSITTLAEAVKKIMVDVVYQPLCFHQMMIPKLVDWSVWLRSGHAEGLYQGGFEPYFVVQPKEANPELFEEIADFITITKTIPSEMLFDKITAPIGGLSYAQCPPFWPWLQGKTLAKESLPIKIYDWSGPTYRYESGSAFGFERVDELHRIETLFIGSPEQVKKIGVETRYKIREVFEKVLELEVREARVMPWWLEQASQGETSDEDELIVGTIDYEAYMPYRGSREESEWLEIQNISIIGHKYPKGFTVKAEGNIELWSGCGGGSFERILTAFIAQKGLDRKNWPDSFQKYVDEIPEPIKFL